MIYNVINMVYSKKSCVQKIRWDVKREMRGVLQRQRGRLLRGLAGSGRCCFYTVVRLLFKNAKRCFIISTAGNHGTLLWEITGT